MTESYTARLEIYSNILHPALCLRNSEINQQIVRARYAKRCTLIFIESDEELRKNEFRSKTKQQVKSIAVCQVFNF